MYVWKKRDEMREREKSAGDDKLNARCFIALGSTIAARRASSDLVRHLGDRAISDAVCMRVSLEGVFFNAKMKMWFFFFPSRACAGRRARWARDLWGV